MLSHFSFVWVFETLWTVAPQAPLSMGILQARTLESAAMPFSSGSNLCLLCLFHWQVDFFVTRILYHLGSPVLIIHLSMCLCGTTHQTFPNYFLHIHAEMFSHLLPYTCLMLRPYCLSFLLLACWHLPFSVLLFWQMFLVVFLAQVTNGYPVLLLPPFCPCFHQLKTKFFLISVLFILLYNIILVLPQTEYW